MFADGQFDASNITLKRLKVISQVYTKILIALHHSRIEYPEIDVEDKKSGNNIDKRKGAKDSPKIADGSDRKDSTEAGL